MAWYRTGTVTVTNGSANVTGVGTNFVSAVQRGDGFVGPDGRSYEITAIVSATQITLAAGYLGSSQSGAAYAIFPTQSRVVEQATALDGLITAYQGVFDNAGQGRFADGTTGAPGVRFAADGDTGVRRTGTNAMALVAGGVDRLLIDGAGVSLPGNLQGAAAQSLGPLLCAYGGAPNGITLTYGVNAVTVGTAVRFLATAANTGSVGINLDGKGAVACRTVNGAVLPAGYIRTDAFTTAIFNGTNWIVGREPERGANANGEYTRFSDGLQICTISGISVSGMTTAIGAMFRPSSNTTWSFPAAFSSSPVAVAEIDDADCVASLLAPSATSVAIRPLSLVSKAGSVNVRGLAIGRWF